MAAAADSLSSRTWRFAASISPAVDWKESVRQRSTKTQVWHLLSEAQSRLGQTQCQEPPPRRRRPLSGKTSQPGCIDTDFRTRIISNEFLDIITSSFAGTKIILLNYWNTSCDNYYYYKQNIYYQKQNLTETLAIFTLAYLRVVLWVETPKMNALLL